MLILFDIVLYLLFNNYIQNDIVILNLSIVEFYSVKNILKIFWQIQSKKGI